MDAARLLSRSFMKSHPQAAATVLEKSAPEELMSLFKSEPTYAGEILKHIPPYLSASVLSSLDPGYAASVIQGFPEDLSVRILRQMGEDVREAMLHSMNAELERSLRSRLRYPDGTAASFADPHVLTLPEGITVADAMKLIRNSTPRVQYYLYVLGAGHHLVGVITLRDLMAAPPRVDISAIMNPNVARLAASSGAAGILLNPNWRSFHALPVVDAEKRFLGVIRHETVQRLREEALSKTDKDHLLDMLLSMSDIYWIGLSGILKGFGTEPRSIPVSSRQHGESEDARK